MNIAVITAGGVGTRMHSKDKPKQFLEIYGKPIIIHTLEKFDKHPDIDCIVIACVENWIQYTEELIKEYSIKKVRCVVKGGTTGQLSIYNGLCAAEKISNSRDTIVLVHDGVRPLIDGKTITDNIEAVKKYGAAITSVKVKETVIEIDSEGNVKQVPERANSMHARAPQSFYLNDLIRNQRKAINEGMTSFVDSCSLMKYYGESLHVIEGRDENIKVTTPDDFYSMRAILTAREDTQIYGYDEH